MAASYSNFYGKIELVFVLTFENAFSESFHSEINKIFHIEFKVYTKYHCVNYDFEKPLATTASFPKTLPGF